MQEYDLFVIGAGSGGVRTARMAAGFGARVAIVEDLYLGGTCVNVGCVPKKLYSYASHFHYDFEDSEAYGWSGLTPEFDWPTLRDNKIQEISRLNEIYRNILQQAGVEIISGHAVLQDSHTVQVGEQQYKADRILVATGGWPFVPDIPGKELALTSNEVFDLKDFPESILIVGGGYIAVEFAGIFAGLGAKTSLSYRGKQPLNHFDRDLRDKFTTELGRHVNLLLGTTVETLSQADGGKCRVHFADGKQEIYDCVLYATGRKSAHRGAWTGKYPGDTRRQRLHRDQ